MLYYLPVNPEPEPLWRVSLFTSSLFQFLFGRVFFFVMQTIAKRVTQKESPRPSEFQGVACRGDYRATDAIAMGFPDFFFRDMRPAE